MTADKRVLVTGGTGFLGRQAVAALLSRGFEVHVLTRSIQDALPAGAVAHYSDLLNLGSFRSLIDEIRPQYLLHAAWYAEHGKYWDAIENVYWLRSTIALVEAFADAGGARVLGVGTCAEYDWSYAISIENVTPERPESLYGKCKLAAGTAVAAIAKDRKLNSAWARIFFPFGPGEPATRLVPSIVLNLLSGTTATCRHGRQFRDFLYVADAGDALAALLDSDVTGVVNVGSGEPIRIGEIASRLGDILDRPDLLEMGVTANLDSSSPMLVASNRRLSEEVGWVPRYTLDEGLEASVAWWKRQNRV